MSNPPFLLRALRRLLRPFRRAEPGEESSRRRTETGGERGRVDVPPVTCEEAAARVYEFLDGELDERNVRSIRHHLEQCRRCYPMYDWERLFLDAVSEHGSRPESNEELRSRLAELLEREPPT